VVDVRDGRRISPKRDRVVLYPGDGQKNVATTFLNNEHPSPTPPEGVGKKLGYCVTAIFPPGAKVENAEATLLGPNSATLEAWVSTPSRPATDRALQMNTVCIIAKAPLRPQTSYTVTVTATVDGRELWRTWRFTTGAP
jgi:hypothetical protein